MLQKTNILMDWIDQFTETTGRALAWLTMVMVVLVVSIVVGRYFLGLGSIALQESVTYLHAMVFMLGLAFTLKRGGHVRVDIFYRNSSASHKKLINTLGTIFFLGPMIGVVGYYSIDFVTMSWSVKEISTEPGGLSFVFIQKSFIFLLPLVLMLAGTKELFKAWK